MKELLKGLLRTEIAFLKPYEAQVIAGNVKLDANENPFPWPEGMREELIAEEIEFTRYPDNEARDLRKALSKYNGVKIEEILVGNGSDELIQIILHTFGGKGKSLMIHPPTFGMYAAAAAITSTSVLEVPLREGIELDLEKMLHSEADVNIIIICNPNNPTGALFKREDILKILQTTKALVVIDEAYAEFAGVTMLDLIHEYPNLLIMRTFSKAFGMAALRLGYVMGNSELIGYLNKVRQPFNVNAFSQKAGIVALKYATDYQKQIKILKKEIDMLYNELRKINGLKVWSTDANFLLFQPDDSDYWARELSSKGFTVRNLGDIPGVGKTLRMSAGTPEENKAFLKAIQEISKATAQ